MVVAVYGTVDSPMERIDTSDQVETLKNCIFQKAHFGFQCLYAPLLEGMCQRKQSNTGKLGLMKYQKSHQVFQPWLNAPAKVFRVGENVAPTRNPGARS